MWEGGVPEEAPLCPNLKPADDVNTSDGYTIPVVLTGKKGKRAAKKYHVESIGKITRSRGGDTGERDGGICGFADPDQQLGRPLRRSLQAPETNRPQWTPLPNINSCDRHASTEAFYSTELMSASQHFTQIAA
jgi:hypothetical protein